jgi:hypothetical protein
MTRASGGRDVTTLVDHFERVLGPIHTGWSVDPDGAPMPFQIVRFAGGADADSVGYSTLGLSRYPLSSPTSGREIRQELLMLAPDSLSPDRVVSLLLQVGSTALRARRALLRGDVIGPAGALVPQSSLTALYVTMPVYFPDAFATFTDEDGDVVIAWLVPISTREADFVSRRGWDAFEDKLVDQDPDLVDFTRAGMSL